MAECGVARAHRLSLCSCLPYGTRIEDSEEYLSQGSDVCLGQLCQSQGSDVCLSQGSDVCLGQLWN
jgi:hypothetical protein